LPVFKSVARRLQVAPLYWGLFMMALIGPGRPDASTLVAAGAVAFGVD
jgi:hypothetical protein